MKKSACYLLGAAAGAMLLAQCTPGPSGNGTANAGMDKNEKSEAVLENIFARKSVRNYQKKTVSKDTLDLLVKAGMAAPTGMNRQPWEFVIFTDAQAKDVLADKLPYAKMLKEAPAAIVVVGNTESSKLWMEDCCAATENILLAAEALGLGAVWTAAYPYEERMEAIRSVLGIPDPYIPLCLIPIGYPEGEQQAKDKWKPEKIHYDKW